MNHRIYYDRQWGFIESQIRPAKTGCCFYSKGINSVLSSTIAIFVYTDIALRPGKRNKMTTYIQITMFPDLDRRLIGTTLRAKRAKRLPVEKYLDLFPRKERQLAFEDYFPSFKVR